MSAQPEPPRLAELTDPLVASLPPAPPGRRKYRVQDRAVRGFYVEVLESGNKTYRVRNRDRRRRQRDMRIGRAEEVSARQARKRAREIRAAYCLGGDPAAERARLAAIPTLRSFVEGQFLPYAKAQFRCHGDYEAMMRLRILPRFGQMPLDEITAGHVAAFKAALQGSGLSNARINRHLALLRSALNLAVKWGCFAGPNPAAAPAMLREQPRELFLGAAETQRLLLALASDRDRAAATALTLLTLSGARKGEVLGARWRDLDRARRVLVVPISKSGRRREIVLSEAAMEVISGLPAGTGDAFMFPSSRRRGRPLEDLRGVWARAKAAAGLPAAAVIHTLRHSMASQLINAGESLFVVGRLLGHSRAATTEVYAHLSDDTLRRAANRVTNG